MLKKKLSTFLAVALAAVMLPTTFLAGEWDTNGGEAEMEWGMYGVEPIIQVELPGDMAFAVNPLYLDANEDGISGDAQIVSDQYIVKNWSNIDVLVTAATKVRADGEKIAFLANNTLDTVTQELISTTAARNVYLVQMLPNAGAQISGEAVELQVSEFDLVSGGADEVEGYVLNTTTPAVVNFKLDSCPVSGEVQMIASDCISGFEFAGAVDPNASFYEGDITVNTIFTLTTLTENESNNGYTDLVVNGVTLDATVVTPVEP